MNCPRCGNPLPRGAQSCDRCGLTRQMVAPAGSGNPADYIAQAQQMYNQGMGQLTSAQRAYVEANMAAAGASNPFGASAGAHSAPGAPTGRATGTCAKCRRSVPADAKFCPGCGSAVA